MMNKPRTIVFVYNTAEYLVRFRLGLMRAMRRRGWRVVAAAPPDDHSPTIVAAGIPFVPIPMERKGRNPLADFRLWWRLLGLYRRERPSIVHHFTVKPVIFGSFAARVAGIPGIVNSVPGLGYVFLQGGRLRIMVERLYRLAFSPRVQVVFHNQDDRDFFVRRRMACFGQTHVICGSGVDTEYFAPRFCSEKDSPSSRPAFALVARMLWDKGVREFVAAARICHQHNPHTRFVLAGTPDPGNPSAVSPGWLRSLHALGYMEWRGHVDDVRPVLAEAAVVVLPSYREGAPRSLIEAASMARPIIATDVPGCREVVLPGINGLLVPVMDVAALAEAMLTLAGDPDLRHRMGQAGRRRVLLEFAERRIIRDTIKIYKQLAFQESKGKAGRGSA